MPSNEEVRRRLRLDVERIRGDHGLSESGKRQAIKDVYARAKAEVDANVRAEREQQQSARDRAYRQLFGVDAGDVVSLRDASDRARAVQGGPEQFGRAMKEASDLGDQVLLRALARRAAEKAEQSPLPRRRAEWDVLLSDYAAETGKTKELETLRSLTGGDMAAHLAARMDQHLPKPAEVDQRDDDAEDGAA